MSFSGKCSCQNHAGEDVIAGADTEKIKTQSNGLNFHVSVKDNTWHEQYFTGDELKKLADIPVEELLFLAIQKPWDFVRKDNFLKVLCKWAVNKTNKAPKKTLSAFVGPAGHDPATP